MAKVTKENVKRIVGMARDSIALVDSLCDIKDPVECEDCLSKMKRQQPNSICEVREFKMSWMFKKTSN